MEAENGRDHHARGQRQKAAVTTDPKRPLLDVLREDLQLTGTKYGCGEGRCGACTVLVDGRRTHSCLDRGAELAGKSIITIEGLARGGPPASGSGGVSGRRGDAVRLLHARDDPVHGRPLARDPHPTDAEIVDSLNGNLCRCNGYTKILRAVRRARPRQRKRVTPM